MDFPCGRGATAIKITAFNCCLLAALALTLHNKAEASALCPKEAGQALELNGASLCLLLDDRASPPLKTLERAWIERSANIVAAYYGRFPAPRVVIVLRNGAGHGVGGGRTTNDQGLMIQATVGREVSADTLNDDWVMVHEMIHLALPEIGRSHIWLAEGLAVYVEGIARAQAGNRPVRDVWAEDRREMPRGLPNSGEGGMDDTHTWARTYWGGALFCLQADVAIREQTHNKIGLQTALRAILKETGGYGFERDIAQVLKVGDAATGTQVLAELYGEWRATPHTPNLENLWVSLGVPQDPATQPFDDHAPLAAVRVAITAPP
jgi:hypothetical protein